MDVQRTKYLDKEFCFECRTYHVRDDHLPAWTAWCPEAGQESAYQGRAVRAIDAQGAAEEWTRRFDEGQFEVAAMESEPHPWIPLVYVRRQDGSDSGSPFYVRGELQPVYQASAQTESEREES